MEAPLIGYHRGRPTQTFRWMKCHCRTVLRRCQYPRHCRPRRVLRTVHCFVRRLRHFLVSQYVYVRYFNSRPAGDEVVLTGWKINVDASLLSEFSFCPAFRSKIRADAFSWRSIETQSLYEEKVKLAKEMAIFLRSNVVQGKKVAGTDTMRETWSAYIPAFSSFFYIYIIRAKDYARYRARR